MMVLPAVGAMLGLISILVPQLQLHVNYGIGIFLVGWIGWAFLMPIVTPSKRDYRSQVLFFLVFFPVMYPFILALVPWGLTLAHSTHEIQKQIADGTIKLEIPSVRSIADEHLYGPELQVGAAVAGEEFSFSFEEKVFGFLDGGEDSAD
jgi:hypothetical protein